MNASALRSKSISVCQEEIDFLEIKMREVADEGKMHIYVDNLSEAARAHFKDNDFKIESFEAEGTTNIRISW